MNDPLPSLDELSSQLRRQQLTSRVLVQRCLDAIRQRDGQLQAWVLVDGDLALRQADQCDQQISGGQWRGRLHGIPVGIKDIFDVQDWPTRAGSPLRDQHIAERDAAWVARLRACGAVFLGKTVTTQFACFDPAVTRNPLDPDLSPGGSSSGSAAAVAAGMCPLALGSQTGGSITRPASYCGIAGLKPTWSSRAGRGVVPISYHLDHVGPLARTAADLQTFWQTVWQSPAAAEPNEMSPPKSLTRIEPFFEHRLEPAVRQVFDAACARLQAANVSCRSAELPVDWEEVLRHHRTIMAVEAAEYHQQDYARGPEKFAASVAGLVEAGLRSSPVDYATALRVRRQLRRQLLAPLHSAGFWVTSATTSTPPPREQSTGDPAMNSPWSFLGYPTITVPCGKAGNGMPCGLQIIARPHSESALLRVAVWAETVLGGSAS